MDATRVLESIIELKAEAAYSESQDIGALDQEALFASTERAKWPEILAAGAGYHQKWR
ncbi:NADH dehydrogenase [Bacillus wiedmannii]|nr:NADH dehydrogenase [Bacillus wiedmannii]